MRRTSRASLALLLVSATLIAFAAPPASAAIERRYAGETSQGRRISAQIRSVQGAFRIQVIAVRVRLTCDDATVMDWGIGFGFGSRGFPMPDRRLEIDYPSSSDAVHLHGRFWPGHATGTFSFRIAALDAEEEAMLCDSGELTWEMLRTRPNPVEELDRSSLDGITRVRVSPDGHVTIRTRLL